ncbi:hypothetical protein BRY73_11300 [Ochrobactrum sp. P6BS-III]|nr:hypothetical protein BRY73_11300 [Ochrobactrum sp. P6BS-III]
MCASPILATATRWWPDSRLRRADRARAVPILTESSEPLYPFAFTHYPTQNRFALLLEML